jgi:hypothetical protein
MAEPGGTQYLRRTPAVLNDDLGNGGMLGLFHHHRCRAAAYGVGYETMPVRLGAAHRDVDHAGPDAATIHAHTGGVRTGFRS